MLDPDNRKIENADQHVEDVEDFDPEESEDGFSYYMGASIYDEEDEEECNEDEED